jgi:predicted PurR-regulated permease PerM
MHRDYVSRALDVSIHIGLLILLTAACFLILRPFIPLIAWGIIIAVAAYPSYSRLTKLLGGRSGLAAVISTLVLLAIVIIPSVLLAGSVVDGLHSLGTRLREGTPIIPPPPAQIESWPVIGVPLRDLWALASNNLSAALRTFAPQIKEFIPGLLVASAGIGMAVLQWLLSVLAAGALLANAKSGTKMAQSLAFRFFGDKGVEFQELSCATIRSVTTGIVGVAFIQSFFAAVGFLVAGLPGAGLWSVIFVLAAVLQLGGIVLIPAVIYMFVIASTTKAILFLVWCVVVGVMDNVLKPLLLGRGVAVPMVVVFLGAIGGFIAMGTIGLFVGAVLLSVGYKVVHCWLEAPEAVRQEIRQTGAAA